MTDGWSDTAFLTGWAIFCGVSFFIVMRLSTQHERFVAREIKRAQALERSPKVEDVSEAAKIYSRYGYTEDAKRAEMNAKEKQARGYETAARYDEAAQLYEELEMWQDAGRARSLATAAKKAQAPPPAPPPQVVKEKETVKEIIRTIKCKYCGKWIDITETTCPSCGGNLS